MTSARCCARGKRYMSNITISEDAAELASLPTDTLAVSMSRYTHYGVFTGRYAGPGRYASLKQVYEAGSGAP